MALQIPKAWKTNSEDKALVQARADYARKKNQMRADTSMQESLLTHAIGTPATNGIETFEAEKEMDRLGQLDYATWLPFAAPVYKISPHIEDYIIVNTLVCPSDIPNRNGIAFPARELAAFQPPPTNRQSFKAWTGCPIHLEHDNEDHEKAYGVMFDSALTKVTGYGGGKLWKVMGLLGVDKNKYPDMAGKVLRKEINTYSMGALVDYFTCGYCGTECNAKHVCSHITSPQNVNWKLYNDFDGSSHLAFLNAHGISPIECSIVADPAWAPALSDEVFDPWSNT
jgi:hypothetical protein